MEDCPLKAKVVNRIGSRLKIYMPANGNFTIYGIMFNSLDSVLDCISKLFNNIFRERIATYKIVS